VCLFKDPAARRRLLKPAAGAQSITFYL